LLCDWFHLLVMLSLGASALGQGVGTPVISEFLASNSGGLRDEDGDSPDWIEIHNPGTGIARLGGWFLTDSTNRLTRWAFPEVELPADGRLVVFASGKNRTNAPATLHTSFALSVDGGYLALVRPDGRTIASGHRHGPLRANLSMGLGRSLAAEPLLKTGAPARFLIPDVGADTAGWTGAGDFDESAWATGTTGLGFDSSNAASGLLGFWDFNDATEPSVARDRGDGKRDGRLSGARFGADATGRTGRPGDRALECLGNGSMTVPDAARGMFDAAIAHDALTISLWVNGGAAQPAQQSVFWAGSQADGGGNRSLNVHLPWSDSVVYWDTGCCDPGLHRISVSVADPTRWKGRWNHYVFQKQGDIKRIFLNGARIAEGVNTENLAAIRSFFLGSGAGGSGAYQGRIDDAAVWGVALEPAQIQALAAGTSPLEVRRFGPLVATDLGPAMRGISASALVRIPFHIDDPSGLDVLVLRLRYDDGFVAWINGTEVARRNAPDGAGADRPFDATASASRPAGAALVPEDVEIRGLAALLRPGRNVLAIRALNRSPGDATLLLQPELLGGRSLGVRLFTEPTPGAPNGPGFAGWVASPRFEPGRGFHDGPVDVRLGTATPGATLVYTTNGSVPSLTNGTVAPGVAAVVRLSATTPLRAAAFLDDHAPGEVETHTYVLPATVAAQRRPAGLGASWPGGAPTDFAIDARVVSGARPGHEFTNALTRLPTLSVALPERDLFGPAGLYANPGGRDDAWEREASFEWLFPDGRRGFQRRAGLRIHGNISRDKGFTPKHSFGVAFRGAYGSARLDVPIFADTPARGFDWLVLRAGSTDTWPCVEWDTLVDGVKRWYRKDASYIRDQWVRDSQLALGHPSSHGTFAHLYLNGLYWGLYNVCERPDAEFAALHLGGDADEYDVLADFAEVRNGDATAWRQLMTAAGAGLSGNANYQRLMGNHPDGTRNPALPVLLDVENLVDYMILSIFIGSDDWPNHNWWASRRRGPSSRGFGFFAWDQEISINSLVKQRSSWGPVYAEADVADTPTYVYARARANAEFRMLFADRIQRHLFDGGALSLSRNLARWAARIAEIDHAIVAESARWGDYQRPAQPFLREREWLTNDLWMRTTFFPSNHVVAMRRFRSANLYPAVDPPRFSRPGGVAEAGAEVTLTHPNATGTIHLTTDGSDPRRVGGGISPAARAYSGAVPINGRTRLKARVLQGTTWSALAEAEFLVPGEFAALQPTELSYHPPDTAGRDGDDLEFVELQNTGTARLRLGGLRFSEGIGFGFDDDAAVEPGAHVVLVRDAGAFAERFPGVAIAGVYTGRLDNAGEALVLDHAAGFRVFAMTYDDAPPWPAAADGLGASLQRARLDRRPDDPAAWVAAAPTPGSPFGGPATEGDTDGDGLPDAWERRNGTDPSRDDAAADPDADGFTNAAEFLAGTDPLDATSLLRLEWLGLDVSGSPGSVRLAFQAAADRSYAVQVRTDLTAGPWTQLLRIAPGPEPRRVTVADPAAGPARHYRLITPAPEQVGGR
jgi:hypothetical protein